MFSRVLSYRKKIEGIAFLLYPSLFHRYSPKGFLCILFCIFKKNLSIIYKKCVTLCFKNNANLTKIKIFDSRIFSEKSENKLICFLCQETLKGNNIEIKVF